MHLQRSNSERVFFGACHVAMHLALVLSLVLHFISFGNALPRAPIRGNDDALTFVPTSASTPSHPYARRGSLPKRDNSTTGVNPRFPASGKWLNVSCQDDQTNNLELSFEKQWKAADGPSEFDLCNSCVLLPSSTHLFSFFPYQPHGIRP